MHINTELRGLLCLRRMARKLWPDPALQRKWLRAYLNGRKWGGLLIEGAPAKGRRRQK